MTFEQAVRETPDVSSAYCPGLQAIRRCDRTHMDCPDTSVLAGSINLDEAVETLYPSDPRWDYGIGLVVNQRDDRVIWVEVHPASTSNVGEMLRKRDWLRAWLKTSAPKVRRLQCHAFYWVASGRIAISRNSPQARRLAESGMRFPTKHLKIDRST